MLKALLHIESAARTTRNLRFPGLRANSSAGETACLRGRAVFYEFAERFAPELLAGAMEDYWPPIELWIEVAGLFRAEEEEGDPDQRPMSRACFGPSTWQPGNPPHYTALLIRLTRLQSGGMTALWCGMRK
jgi:hypothetical protein